MQVDSVKDASRLNCIPKIGAFFTKGFTDFLPEFTQIFKQTFTRFNDNIYSKT